MKTLVYVAHPNIVSSKVNRAWRDGLQGSDIAIRELTELYGDGPLDILVEQEQLLTYERIVFQHPFYWYSVPPILKRYFDEVLTYGFAYGENGDKLAGKEWIEAVSCGGPEAAYCPGGYNRFTVQELLRPVEATANLCQMFYRTPFVVYGALRLSEEEITASVKRYKAYILDPNLDISTPSKLFSKFSGN